MPERPDWDIAYDAACIRLVRAERDIKCAKNERALARAECDRLEQQARTATLNP